MQKKVLVAGGAGFIGSHLCEFLLEKKCKVICADNLSSGRKQNIAHLLGNKDFSFIEHDITKELGLEGIQQIYHLASRASPLDYQEHPIETALANSLGTKNLLDLALANNSRLLFTSTSEIYGEPKEHPQKETYWGNVNPIGLRSCYDESKRFGEALIMSYNREKNANACIARIFNTFGPRMRENDGRVISNFIVQALKGEPITVHGEGTQTRCFCYVQDTVRGLFSLMESKEPGPINIGSSEEKTILEAAKEIISLTHSKSKIIFKPMPADDPTRRRPDTSKAKNLLNWQPGTEFRAGLGKTIEYFEKEIFYG